MFTFWHHVFVAQVFLNKREVLQVKTVQGKKAAIHIFFVIIPINQNIKFATPGAVIRLAEMLTGYPAYGKLPNG